MKPKYTVLHQQVSELSKLREQAMASFDDLAIPFDNNQEERNLRIPTMQQQISDAFRSDDDAGWRGGFRGHISSLSK